LLVVAGVVVAIPEQFLRHGHGRRNGDAHRGPGDDLLPGRHPALLVLVVVLHREPPWCRRG